MRAALLFLISCIISSAQVGPNPGGGGGGSATPGAPAGSVQFNNAGALGGASHFIYYPSLPIPSAPTVITSGDPGVTPYGYKVAFRSPTGTGIASAETVIATGNETLDGTNFNVISVPSCSELGVTASVYRTSAPGSYDFPYSIAEVSCGGTVNDIGGGVDGGRSPQVADTATGMYLIGTGVMQKLIMGDGAPNSLIAPFAASSTFTDLSGPVQSSGYFGATFNPSADAGAYNTSVRISAQSTSGNHFAQGLVGLITQTDFYDGTGNVIGYANYTTAQGDGSGHVNDAYGIYGNYTSYSSSQVTDNVFGYWTKLELLGGTVGKLYNFYASAPNQSGTLLGESYGLWIGDQSAATNGYALWYDGPGNTVWRVKADGVMANYNPSFSPKYTPGATSFEREVVQWNSDVAEIGTEKGSTGGTLRPLRLLGTAIANVAQTVSALPTCTASTGTPWRASVTDAVLPALGAAVTGGGAVFANVHCSLTTGTYLVDGL